MKKILALIVVLLFVTTPLVFAEDCYLYDVGNRQLLRIKENESRFSPLAAVEVFYKMFPTANPEEYLIIDKTPDGKGGTLKLFNIRNGELKTLSELGCLNEQYLLSKGRKDFFVAYMTGEAWSSSEILHFNVEDGTIERLQIKGKIYQMVTASDDCSIYVLSEAVGEAPKVSSIPFSQFRIEKSVSINMGPNAIYPLDHNCVGIINENSQNGQVKVFSFTTGSVVQELSFVPHDLKIIWYPENRTLLIINGQQELAIGLFTIKVKGESDLIKVTDAGIDDRKCKPWFRMRYYPENDKLYILHERNMEVIDYGKGTTDVLGTGTNASKTDRHYYSEDFELLPDKNQALIYCTYTGECKVYGFKDRCIIKEFNCTRPKPPTSSYIEKFKSFVLAEREPKGKVAIVSQATERITVFDARFNQLTTVDIGEYPYEAELVNSNLLICTRRKLLSYDLKTMKLKEVFRFSEESNHFDFFSNNNCTMVSNRLDLAVLDSKDLQLLECYPLVGSGYSWVWP